MSNHTGIAKRDTSNNLSRNVCYSFDTTAVSDSIASMIMNNYTILPFDIEENLFINENIDLNSLLIISDDDYSLLQKNIVNPPRPNKALKNLFDAYKR